MLIGSPKRYGYPSFRRSRGFTLLELMVVVTIIALFAALALPVAADVIRDQRTRGDAMEVVNALRMARARAMGRGSAILVRFGNAQEGSNLRVMEIREAIESTGGGTVLPSANCRTSFPPPTTNTAPFPADENPPGVPTSQTLQFRRIAFKIDAGGVPLGTTSAVGFQLVDGVGALAPTPLADVCFSPTGRVFARLDPNVPLTPLDGFVDITLQRNITPDNVPATTDPMDLLRRARVMHDGNVRFITCDPKVGPC